MELVEKKCWSIFGPIFNFFSALISTYFLLFGPIDYKKYDCKFRHEPCNSINLLLYCFTIFTIYLVIFGKKLECLHRCPQVLKQLKGSFGSL